ncbi:MAG TPA: ABC transporter permease [Pyrinomonadaceae bacterium]|nr:ABC transporter permease [Pyrinomonadaceae bacterium]
MNNLLQDIRYGVRGLLRQPGFAIVAIFSLALGIGANTAIFSVVNGVLLNPLPFPQPEQLMTIHQSKPNFETGAIPYPNFRDLKERNQTFSSMAISRAFGFSLIGAGETERVQARLVSAEYFSVLELKPLLGRTFIAGEDESGAAPVALISEGLWRRKFGAAQDVLQKGITLDDKSYSVVGVIPSSFNMVRDVDVYVPIGQWVNPALKSRRSALGLHGIGRLKPGVTQAQGEADLNRVMNELAATYPDTNKGQGAKLVSLRQRLVGDIQPILWLLLGAVGFVLLIACVNVSNLLLARSTGRAREFAIRAALGAGRGRLVIQSLTESTLLAVVGGALGLLVAAWGTKAALGVLPTALPRSEEVQLDGRVLMFTFAISLLTGLLAGVIPALKTSQGQVSETLKEGGRGSSSGRARAQGIFVAVEMALALVLLIGAGLMIRSLTALWHVDPGFRTDNVLTFGLTLPPSAASARPEAVRASLRELNQKISSTPGVQAASFSLGAFPLANEDDLFFWIDGQPKPASQSEMNMALIYRVEPDYLKAMDIPLKQGRFFNDQDDERAPQVAVIDEAFARQFFGTESPLGKRIQMDGATSPVQIVGVVGHVHQWSLDAGDADGLQAQLYTPFRATPDNALPAGAGVVVRGSGGTGDVGATLFSSIRAAVASQNSQNVISNPQTMNEVISDSLAERRFSMILLGSFSVVALLLASLGIYGVISYLVGQRTHELGIRIALGAQRRDVVQLVLNHGMKMTVAGVLLGLAVAFAVTRLLSRMLFGVTATDPITFTGITLVLLGVAFVACLVPAFRATKVDPLVALREE